MSRKEPMFLVYDLDGIPTVRAIQNQSSEPYVTYNKKIMGIRIIGKETLSPELTKLQDRPIYQMTGELSLHKTL